MRCCRWGLLLVLLALGCKSSPPPSSSSSRQPAPPKKAATQASPVASASEFDKILPDAAPPFLATAPIQLGQGYVRQEYVSGRERIEITIAYFGQESGAFDRWVASSANYPQAQLALPAAQANGFFSCTSDLADAPCDLHIQLRSGFHVEVMGNGRVPRQDLTGLMTQIRLGVLADSTLAAL